MRNIVFLSFSKSKPDTLTSDQKFLNCISILVFMRSVTGSWRFLSRYFHLLDNGAHCFLHNTGDSWLLYFAWNSNDVVPYLKEYCHDIWCFLYFLLLGLASSLSVFYIDAIWRKGTLATPPAEIIRILGKRVEPQEKCCFLSATKLFMPELVCLRNQFRPS